MPDFDVWETHRDDEDDYGTFEASCPQVAATLWAEEVDLQGDFQIVQGESIRVTVRSPDGTIDEFDVHGEYRETYWATVPESKSQS